MTDPSTAPDPTYGWGILATGRIAASFARDLRLVPGARLAAVGSRSQAPADAFAREHGDEATTAHASYAALVEDPSVDVVYVASPHALHLEHAALAFAAGKHVLCEKPLTLNTAEAEEMVALARRHDRFLMEAMWMACNPVVRALQDPARFGTPRQVHADLGFVVDKPDDDRLLDPALGAGALLDMGIYPLTFAHLLLGEARQLRAVANVNERGVDMDVAVVALYDGGATSALTASMTGAAARMATVATDRGTLVVPAQFHHPAYATWTPIGGESERVDGVEPLIGSGLGNEAAEVQRCLREGLRESPLVPHAQTLTLLRQMDAIREQVGVRYAADR
ncbi:MAG: Gfo/Idh/MocA family protein [Nocardioides sp.]